VRLLVVSALFALSAGCGRWTRQDEILLARNIQGTESGFTAIDLATPIQVWRPMNQLWLQIPSLARVPGRALLDTGAELSMEAVAEVRGGTRLPLAGFGVIDVSAGRFLVARLPSASGRENAEITRLWLKSRPSVRIARVIWLAYDPRDFISGETSPKDSGLR
jgi:hypothetical protein